MTEERLAALRRGAPPWGLHCLMVDGTLGLLARLGPGDDPSLPRFNVEGEQDARRVPLDELVEIGGEALAHMPRLPARRNPTEDA